MVVNKSGGGADATGVQWGEPSDAAEHPIRHRAAPTIKNNLAQNIYRISIVPRMRNPFNKQKKAVLPRNTDLKGLVRLSKLGELFQSALTFRFLKERHLRW